MLTRFAALILLFAGGCLLAGVATMTVQAQPSDTLKQEVQRILDDYPEAKVAVSIRDDETSTTLDVNGDRVFHAASTMKTPVAIEIFRRAEAGAFSLDDSLLVENRFRSIVDGSEYQIESDSDDAIYEQLGSKMSIRELVYQMITVSSNLATNLLIDFVSAEAVQETTDNLGASGMKVRRGVEDLKAFEQGKNNETTSAALAEIFHRLMRHDAVSETADNEVIDIHLDQEFDDMIPAGLPAGFAAAHKTGSITAIHHDAGIVFPEEQPPYVLVILIEGIEDNTESAALGAELTRIVNRHLRGSAANDASN